MSGIVVHLFADSHRMELVSEALMLSIVKHIGNGVFEIKLLLEDEKHYVRIIGAEAQALLKEIEGGGLFDVEATNDTLIIKSTAWLDR